MVEGLSHITLITQDLARMSTILETVFDAREVYASGDNTFSLSREKFYLVGGVWVAIMEGESLPTQTYNHIAFKIAPADIDSCRARIEALGLVFRESRPRVEGEGHSLYFYDPDNHLFELHTGTLEERLQRYGVPSLPGRDAEPEEPGEMRAQDGEVGASTPPVTPRVPFSPAGEG